MPPIDFKTIRPHRRGREGGFEELTRQLVLAEGLQNVQEIEHRGPGADGGVEILVRFKDGTSWGWQSKYFIDGFDTAQVQQLKKSFKSALSNYGPINSGALTRYIIVVPVNLRGPGTGANDDERRRWNRFKEWAEEEAIAIVGRTIEIEPWDESSLIFRLQHNPSILSYWFDRDVFTEPWFRDKLDNALKALDERYNREDHVEVKALRVFDVVFRRKRVKDDTRRDFTEARSIHPIAPDAAGPGTPSADPHAIELTNQALNRFLALEGAIDQPVTEPWPVDEWRRAWECLAYQRLSPLRRAWQDALTKAGHDWKSDAVERISRLLFLPGMEREVFAGEWHRLLPADPKRALLFAGPAGTGKSHLLAKAAEDALNTGAPVVLFLGQDFTGGNPRTAMIDRLGLAGRSFEVVLGTLDSAAAAANTRALIIIDALNEGQGIEIWPRELERLLDEITKFPRLMLAVSCRSEYLDATLPETRRARFFQVDVEGFRSFEERKHAMRVYLDRRGIIRPASPSLDPEFTNPLFLRIACEALIKSGQTVFPRGLRGAKQVFDFVFKTRGRFLGAGRDGTDDLVCPLIRSLQDLASAMADGRNDHLSIPAATDIVNQAFSAYPAPPGKTWLDILRGNGFLRKDILPAAGDDGFSSPREVIRFTFQRLCDHLMAEALLKKIAGVNQAFVAGGPLDFVIRRRVIPSERPLRNTNEVSHSAPPTTDLRISVKQYWPGLCGALWIAIAERFERELIDLPDSVRQDGVKRLAT